MPIDIEKAIGAELAGISFSWSQDDIILYNLALGAGDPPDDPAELKYAYEGNLVAVPSFGTIPPFAMMMSLGAVDGIDIDLTRVLHGDQALIIHDSIPTSGTVTQSGRVADVLDKGRGALIVLEVVSKLENTAEPLFTNRSGIYVRGEGGFGRGNGPSAGRALPGGEPDAIVESHTLAQQALLYRMSSGDKNPLHADPAFAALAGFDRPILHGLCTYGVVLKAVTESVLDGDPSRVGSYEARFTGHVFPGETLLTRIWEDGDRFLIETEAKERGKTVLANAEVVSRSQGAGLR
jgi:acyl dehydratase